MEAGVQSPGRTDQFTANFTGVGVTASSTLEMLNPDQKEYIKKLEHSISWMEEKLQRARKDFKVLKKENESLKDSSDNHIFINEKLNKALKKSEERNEKLTERLKKVTNESVILQKRIVEGSIGSKNRQDG